MPPGHDRGAARHGLDHHQPERLRPVDRKQQRLGVAQELGFLVVADLADILDQRIGQQGLDFVVEVGPVGLVDLGRDLQAHARATGDLDRPVGAFLRRDPAQEGEIGLPGYCGEAVGVGREPVRNGGQPIGLRERPALIVGDRDQRVLGPARIDAGQVLEVQPAVQSSHGPAGHVAEERKMHHVDMEVQDVELVPSPVKLVHHREMAGEIRLQRARVEPEGLVAAGNQGRPGPRIAAREQGDIMTKCYQGVGKMRHDSLSAAVQSWRHRLV